jgi:hypothetical protein
MLIPYAMRYSTRLGAQVPKLVTCEECGLEYVYLMKRTAEGEGTSLLFVDNAGAQNRAAQEAHEALIYKLQTSCDAVPCPACGHYQEHMIPRARYHHNRWMLKAGLALVPFAAIGMLVAMVLPPRGTYSSPTTSAFNSVA